jgi:glycosyltransferase involved in cell wall biosynthesis
MVLLVNQHTVPVFLDIVNAFAVAKKNPVLFTGHVEKGSRPFSPAVQIKKSIAYNRKSAFSRFFTWLIFTFHYTLYLSVCRKPELILVATNPPLTPIITACIATLRKIPFYILLYDLYPEALFQAGFVTNKNIVFKIWARVNWWMFRHAKSTFTLSESMREATRHYVRCREKIQVIHNWADASYIHPIEKNDNPFITKHRLYNKFVVLYSGNMGLTHDLESLVEAAVKLKEESRLVFVLIGDGGKKKKLEKLVSQTKPGNVLFLPFQDEKDFPYAMAAADVGVVTLGVGAGGISVPSKTYVNLAAGLCLLSIAPKSSELSRLVEDYDAGLAIEPGRPDEVATVIRALMKNEERLEYHKRKSLEAAQFFTPDNAYQYVKATSIPIAVTA